jgi:prevent-host-death family protein
MWSPRISARSIFIPSAKAAEAYPTTLKLQRITFLHSSPSFRTGHSAKAGKLLAKEETMRVTNTVELKNKTNQILREVMKGSPVIITFRGKPAASITPLKEEDLEDFVLENSRAIQKMIAQAEKDIQAGKVVSLKEYLAKLNE